MKVKNSNSRRNLYLVVIGCGKVGANVASIASSQGHNVVVVDKNEKSFENLSVDFTGFTISGDATEKDVLLEAKVDKADYVFVLTEDDNTNFLISMACRYYFAAQNVIARVYEPDNIKLFEEYNVKVVSPTVLAINELSNIVAGDIK
ncbi:potassium channel family protein [Thermosipho atlanticus]|uniref:Trk system potassium uptake protein TrkA n=1 Tax=Thermosipho atlanticus DSM 15807 TaxID=1123380 RepID=A0A1M5U6H9_9BACT|nr:TrkA family potassium uptake protein [Thermosipho atlanticus]SHH58655.1 trk system potassium uptake protein TrkA [Thermosipho atlanticus DSM 15807]